MNGTFNMNKCYGVNEPFNSPSAIYFGNFAIYFICKSEKLKK